MLNAIGFVFKLVAFSVLVIVAANWVSWDGRTLSEHVRLGIRHAERSGVTETVRDWTRNVTEDAREGAERKAKKRATKPIATVREDEQSDRAVVTASAPKREEAPAEGDRIPSSERQKLRNLIRELNSTHGKD